jgi:uncharacterized protein (DUF2236 family)
MIVRMIGGSTFETAVADFCEILELELFEGSVLSAFSRNSLITILRDIRAWLLSSTKRLRMRLRWTQSDDLSFRALAKNFFRSLRQSRRLSRSAPVLRWRLLR